MQKLKSFPLFFDGKVFLFFLGKCVCVTRNSVYLLTVFIMWQRQFLWRFKPCQYLPQQFSPFLRLSFINWKTLFRSWRIAVENIHFLSLLHSPRTRMRGAPFPFLYFCESRWTKFPEFIQRAYFEFIFSSFWLKVVHKEKKTKDFPQFLFS